LQGIACKLDIENRERIICLCLAFLGFSFYQSVIPECFCRGSIAYKVAAAWIPAKGLPE